MVQRCRFLLVPLCLLALAGKPSGQATPAKDDRIIFGHLHLHPSNLDIHKKFWNETLGGQGITFGGNIQAMKFPLDWTPTKGLGLIINLTSSQYTTPPTGGTKATTVNHVGLGVPDLGAALARVKAAGYRIEKDSAFSAERNAKVALSIRTPSRFRRWASNSGVATPNQTCRSGATGAASFYPIRGARISS
jgi:hypothetical protein